MTYELIPLSEIDDLAKHIAIQWIENYTPHGSIMPEIAQKQKLASDIINYSKYQNSKLLDKIGARYEHLKWMKEVNTTPPSIIDEINFLESLLKL